MRTPALLVLTALLPALALACPAAGDDTMSETGTDEAADTDGGETDECTPPGEFADCISGGEAACMSSVDPICLVDTPDNPSLGVCGRDCDSVCDCWAPPAGSEAPVACVQLVEADPSKTCVLDCSGGQACPGEMACLDTLGICVFQPG